MASIVVYDSGVGGLTIYREIVKHSPDHQIVFVSDNEAFPYGTKSETDLIERVQKVVSRVADQYTPDVLVIACNTASTVVLSLLRKQFAFPIVGVVPAIKPAAKASKTKHICLLATPGTVNRSYTDSLVTEFAPDCHVMKIGSSELVRLAEQKLMGESIDLSAITTIIKPVIDDPLIDVLVLACTHFPLLSEELDLIFKAHDRNVLLIDSGSAVALRVGALLENLACLSVGIANAPNNYEAAFTKVLNNSTLRTHLQKLGFCEINHLVV